MILSNVQLENGYSPVANEILDNIVKLPLNGTQWRIIAVVWRYTYGFSRKEHELSEAFIVKAIGISKRFIISELKKLIGLNLITVVREATFTTPKILAFNKNFDTWESGALLQQVNNPSPDEQKVTSTGEQSFTSTGERSFTQDKQYLKQNIKQAQNEYFEAFYAAYPKRRDKQNALQAFRKISPNADLFAVMMDSLETFKKSAEWLKDSGQFIPYPATWLNGRRWEDEITVIKKPNDNLVGVKW